MDLFNVKTGRRQDIKDPIELQNALLGGTHSYAAGTQVDLYGPEGEQFTVPAENVQKAIQSGFRVQSSDDRLVEKYREENKGAKGAAKVFLGQALNQGALGLPELIFNKTGDPLEVAKVQALKKDNDLANTLGGITGFGGSLVAGPTSAFFNMTGKAGNAVAKNIASRLAVEAGQVGSGAFASAGKNIAAKVAGGAAEGAILTAPHAITEAALGDPLEAGQTLLAGVGIGSIFGGALGMGKELLNLGKTVRKSSKISEEQYEFGIKEFAKKQAQNMTGVPASDIEFYLKNVDKFEKTPLREQLVDSINDFVANKKDQVFVAQTRLKQADDNLKSAYKSAVRDLEQSRAPLALAEDINAAMANEKSVLGRMSEEADDLLLKVPGGLPKQALINFIDIVSKNVFPIAVGKKALAGRKDLQNLQKQINSELGEMVSFPGVRQVIRQVRDDIDWNRLSTEFNAEADRARKKFTGTLSDLIKEKYSPEYGQAMLAMEAKSKALSQMNKIFGDAGKTQSVLNKIASKGESEIQERALSQFELASGVSFSDRIAELKKTKDLLELSKRQDLKDVLTPGLNYEYNEAQKLYTRALEAAEPFKKLTPDRTEKAIIAQAYKNPDQYIAKAFKQIERETGEPLTDYIRQRNVLSSFEKGNPNGSRKALAFGAAGTAIGFKLGGPPGAILGGAIGTQTGGYFDYFGGQILKKFLDSQGNKAGLLFIEKVFKNTADRLDSIPNLLEKMSLNPDRPTPRRTATLQAIFKFLDQAREEKDPVKAGDYIEEMQDKISSYLSNPEAFNSKMGPISAALAEGGAPGIAEGLTYEARRALDYLYRKIPRQEIPRNAFSSKNKWKPSDSELYKFAERLMIANDPLTVLESLENRSLSQAQMDTLRTLYPVIHRAIKKKVFEYAAEKDTSLVYSDRIKLSLLIGVPLDESLRANLLMGLQQSYLDQQQQAQEAQQRGVSSGGKSLNLSRMNETQLQRATNK